MPTIAERLRLQSAELTAAERKLMIAAGLNPDVQIGAAKPPEPKPAEGAQQAA